jgi:hypothetical protein
MTEELLSDKIYIWQTNTYQTWQYIQRKNFSWKFHNTWIQRRAWTCTCLETCTDREHYPNEGEDGHAYTRIVQLISQISPLRTVHSTNFINSRFFDSVRILVRVHMPQYVIVHDIYYEWTGRDDSDQPESEILGPWGYCILQSTFCARTCAVLMYWHSVDSLFTKSQQYSVAAQVWAIVHRLTENYFESVLIA